MDNLATSIRFNGFGNVVDIGDMRVQRGKTRRPHSSCHHHNLMFDTTERRVWCKDCEKDVDAFDAFAGIVENFHVAAEKLEKRQADLIEAEGFSIRSIAAKNMDKEWRKRNTVPCCPYCRTGLLPEYFTDSILRTSKAITRQKFNLKS